MQVPWGRKELAVGLFSWAISFVAVGIVLVPIIGFVAGVKVRLFRSLTCITATQAPKGERTVAMQDFKSLTSSDKSFYALLNQVQMKM